jgi:hypothetical protein
MTDRLVTPGSEISPDTHVGTEFEQVPAGSSAEPSEADPDALVEGNVVSTGEELETD